MSPDLSSILQRPVNEVTSLLTSLGYAVHIFREDGWTFAVYDPRPHLVNLTVENGVVQGYTYRHEALPPNGMVELKKIALQKALWPFGS